MFCCCLCDGEWGGYCGAVVGDVEVEGGKYDGLRTTVIEIDLTWRVCREF
jgi:hypothetical protein